MRSLTVALALIATIGSGNAGGQTNVQAALEPINARRAAPDFALEDANGALMRLSDHRGKVVLLDFWASTCEGCIEEIPLFIEIAREYEARGLVVVGVSEDIPYASLSGPAEAWERVKPFVKDHQIHYPVLMGDSVVTADYRITALPLTYLIDTRGRIAASYHGVVERANLEANLLTLLAEPR